MSLAKPGLNVLKGDFEHFVVAIVSAGGKFFIVNMFKGTTYAKARSMIGSKSPLIGK